MTKLSINSTVRLNFMSAVSFLGVLKETFQKYIMVLFVTYSSDIGPKSLDGQQDCVRT